MEQYACLHCGFVHDNNNHSIRLDQEYEPPQSGPMGGFRGHKEKHGFNIFRICPKCTHQQYIRFEEDTGG